MARLIGPDEASREVKAIVGGMFRSKVGRPAQLWSDEAASVPADVLNLDGSPIAASSITIDANSMLPLFQFPPGDVDTVYVTVDGGPAWPVYARTDDRFDGLADRSLSNVQDAAAARANLSVPQVVKRVQGGAVLEPLRVPTLAIDQTWPNRDYDMRIMWVDPDGLTMYALGWEAMVYKSTDGGATWARQGYNSALAALNGTWLKTNAGTLLTFASGTPTTVYRSTNDGVSWSLVHTWPTLGTPRPMGPTGWAIDPTTNYIYSGEYQSVDTGVTTVNVYRSVDDGATWQVFHAFPGPATSDPNRVRHVHAIQWDHVAQRIVVMTGDSDPAAGMYRVNAAGTALEPMLLNSQVPLTGSTEGARAIGFMPFPDYIAWTGDATSNPYLMRVPRSELGKPSVAAERVYRLNSTGWFATRAASDGTRWVFASSQESASFRLDTCVHLYAVEDQGATCYEVGALATDSAGLAAIAPVGQPTMSGDVLWLRSHNTPRDAVWKCRLARGTTPLPAGPGRPLVYAWQTVNTSGSVSVPQAASGSTPGVFVIGRDTTPAFVKKLHIFNAGVSDDGGVLTNLKVRVRKKSDGSTLYEGIVPSDRQFKHCEAGGPIASITSLASTDVVEFVVANVNTGAAVSGSAFVTYGWGP